MKATTCSGATGEPGAQHRVLGGDPDRAGVEMADAHHHAARGDQRRGREGELVGAEQRTDHNVAPGLHLPVGQQRHAAAQPLPGEHLLRLGEPELPGHARVLDRGERRRAGATLVAGDDDVVGARLGDAGRHGADARLGHQLHADPRLGIHAAQVPDQLGEILDRVDVVVRRRRDEPDTRRGVAQPRDRLVDLGAGQLTALAGLRTLGDLDLQLVGVDEVVRGDTEARRRDLLDRAPAPVAVGIGLVPRRSPRRPRRCWIARRCGSSRWRAARAPPCSASRATYRRWRSGARCRAPARPHRAAPARSPRGARTGRADSSAGATRRRRARRSARNADSSLDFTACWSAPITSGFHWWCSPSRRQRYSPRSSSVGGVMRTSGNARW